jgi:DNA-nicking Smr family endonuclease
MTRKLPPDYALWEDVARTVEPLHKSKARKKPEAKKQVASAAPAKSGKPAQPDITRAPARRHDPPPLAGLDRRNERRMTRGRVEIESRIDLHGTGIERSRERLLHFLAASRAQGLRMVLVITGKGASPFTVP